MYLLLVCNIYYVSSNLLNESSKVPPLFNPNSLLDHTERGAGPLRKFLCQHLVPKPGSSTSFGLPVLVRSPEAQELDKIKWNLLRQY